MNTRLAVTSDEQDDITSRGVTTLFEDVSAVAAPADDLAAEAEAFIRTFHEARPEAGPAAARLAKVRAEIGETGTYRHTPRELTYGARLALYEGGWCTSGMSWRRVTVRDRRSVRDAAAVARECGTHLRMATNGGHIMPMISVFGPDLPGAAGPCLWNDQLVRYAGYEDSDGGVLGDRGQTPFTETVTGLGWRSPAQRTAFDHLPLVVETSHEGPKLFTLPRDVIQEVPLEHPELPWFVELGLRWHAVPVVSNLRLVIGGVTYPAAPFNVWFIGSEIGGRSLSDETGYGLARPLAEIMGLDTSSERTLWRDIATVELNRAVLHSFDAAQVTLTDHHAHARHRRTASTPPRPVRAGFRFDPLPVRRARLGGVARYVAPPERTPTQSQIPTERALTPVVAVG